ncbi:MAG: hypothetical protein ACYSVY_03000, partial [Planctomycetota bacterium]
MSQQSSVFSPAGQVKKLPFYWPGALVEPTENRAAFCIEGRVGGTPRCSRAAIGQEVRRENSANRFTTPGISDL